MFTFTIPLYIILVSDLLKGVLKCVEIIYRVVKSRSYRSMAITSSKHYHFTVWTICT